MRLTLRTLLSYRDGVLNAEDRATLEAKLKESVTARGISERIDASLRNPKLAPIPPDAKDPWFDANQISEYLDDTTPTELVAEVERRCLENNALLSEVASCHSILSRALNQEVEIAETLRERIRSLPGNPQAGIPNLHFQRMGLGTTGSQTSDTLTSHTLPAATMIHKTLDNPGSTYRDVNHRTLTSDTQAGVAADQSELSTVDHGSAQRQLPKADTNALLQPRNAGQPATNQSVQVKAQSNHATGAPTKLALPVNSMSDARGRGIELDDGLGSQVPEYLRMTDRGRLKPLLTALGLLSGVLITGALSLGSLETVGQLLAPKHVANRTGASVGNDLGKASDLDSPEKIRSTVGLTETSTKPNNSDAGIIKTTDSEESKQDEKATVDDIPKLNKEIDQNDKDQVPDVTRPESDEPETQSEATQSDLPARDDTNPPSETSLDASKLGIGWISDKPADSRNVLLIRDSNGSATKSSTGTAWKVAAPNEVHADKTWVIPFVYRTKISLSTGETLITCGDTEISSVVSDSTTSANKQEGPTQTPQIAKITYGRVLVFPSNASLKTTLLLPTGKLAIEFADANSACAIETSRNLKNWPWMPSSDAEPNFQDAEWEAVTTIIGVAGDITCHWSEDGQLGGSEDRASERNETLSVGDQLVLQDSEARKGLLDATPPWLKDNISLPIDNLAAKDLSRALRDGDPMEVEQNLVELAHSRKAETSSLATRILFQIGIYEGLLGEKGLLAKRNSFQHSIEWLNKIPSYLYSDSRLDSLTQAFKKTLGDQFGRGLRLLISMSDDQLAAGGDELLVDALSAQNTDQSSLAIDQLYRIRGTTLDYQVGRDNAASIEEWKKLLDKEEIRWISQPFSE